MRFMIGIVFLIGCRDDKALNGYDLISDPTIIGNVDSTIILTAEYDTFQSDTISSTGLSTFLEIGQSDNIRTYSLLKFSAISDTAEIIDARLILNTNTLFSEGRSKSAFTATIHQVLTDWQEESVKYENLPQYDPTALSNTTIISSAASADMDSFFVETVTFEFDNAGITLLQSWQDTLNNNFGFFINHENSNFIKEFFSDNSSINQPRLELEIENSNGRDTVLVAATEGAFVVDKLSTLPNGPLYVDNLFTNETVLKFNFSEIPKETVVNNAMLKLNFNEDISTLKASGLRFRMFLLAEPYTDPESVKIDSTFSPIDDTVFPSENPTNVSVTRLLQFWLTEDIKPYGLLIRARTPGLDISKVAFYSNNNGDVLLEPRIEAVVSSAGVGN